MAIKILSLIRKGLFSSYTQTDPLKRPRTMTLRLKVKPKQQRRTLLTCTTMLLTQSLWKCGLTVVECRPDASLKRSRATSYTNNFTKATSVNVTSSLCECLSVHGVGGTGKSFLIEAVRALVDQLWPCEDLTCAIPAPTRLAALTLAAPLFTGYSNCLWSTRVKVPCIGHYQNPLKKS